MTISFIAIVIAMAEAVYICSREAILWLKQEQGQHHGQQQQEMEMEMEEIISPENSKRPPKPNFSFVVQCPSSPSSPSSPSEPHLHKAQIHI
jgi:hypothetical protein